MFETALICVYRVNMFYERAVIIKFLNLIRNTY